MDALFEETKNVTRCVQVRHGDKESKGWLARLARNRRVAMFSG